MESKVGSWRKLLLTPDATLIETLNKINDGNAQIVLIVDEKERLLGTVTDGDIRRGILKGIGLDESVKNVMNSKPISIQHKQGDKEKQIKMMVEHRIHQLPVLDGDGRLIDLKTIDELLQPEIKENLVVMMLGGVGRRLKPLTDNIPKPMLMVGDKPLLEHNLIALRNQGFQHFCFSVGYKAEIIENYFKNGALWDVDIQYIYETEPLGTIGSLTLLEKPRSYPLLIINGDVMTSVNYRNLLNFHEQSKAVCTVGVREFDYQVPYGVIELDHLKIASINEKPTFKHFVNAGIYVLNPSMIAKIPKNTFYHMTDLLEQLLQHDLSISAFPLTEYWSDIGHLKDYHQACTDVSEVFE